MDQSSRITIHRTDSGYLFRLVGRGTVHESPALRSCVSNAIENGADVVLDLSSCSHLDSTFLGCLVILHQRAQQSDGAMEVLVNDPKRKELLGTCHLDRLLSFTDQCPTCLGSAVTLELTGMQGEELGQHLVEAHRSLAELGGPFAASFSGIVQRLTDELQESHVRPRRPSAPKNGKV